MVEEQTKKAATKAETNMVAFDFERTPITQIADYIIITASKNNTSDIHFDPREDGMMVRFRIDGDLQDYTHIPKAFERNLTTRLKILANMNITESRLPQDGAIKGEFGGKYLDMRVSCLPLNQGEKIVIRILDYTRSLQGIDSLGFNPSNLVKLKRMMGVPNGIILVTGATGSGKSTTVYSILQGLNKPEINIITVEDPIEMNIEGMNQVQVNAEIGMTFAAALRSILRQDPNVILIGEIRDSETAQIAVRASITGHLVLSTIHTNNSLSTIERLLDMDVERYLLSTALTGIISQRLAKQLCMKCRVERETTKYEKKVFKKFMNKDVEKVYDANPDGCKDCRKGYKGRIAIQEVLELDEEIRNALNDTKLSKEQLSDMVYTNKTITMLQDALGKCIAGLTSFEEVYRVIEIESDPEDTSNGSSLTKSIDEQDPDGMIPKAPEQKEEKKPESVIITVPDTKASTVQIPTTNVQAQQPVTVEVPKVAEEVKENKEVVQPTPTVTTPVQEQQKTTPLQPAKKEIVTIDKNNNIPIVNPETIAKQTAPITKEMSTVIPTQNKVVQQQPMPIPPMNMKPVQQTKTTITQTVQPTQQTITKTIQQVQPGQQPVTRTTQTVQPVQQTITKTVQQVQPGQQTLTRTTQTVQPVQQTITKTVQQVQPEQQTITRTTQTVQPVQQTITKTVQQVQPVATVQLPKIGEIK